MLPDGITHTKGFVKDPEEARRYLSLADGDSSNQQEGKNEADHVEITERKKEDKNKVDLTKNVFFCLSEMLVLICY